MKKIMLLLTIIMMIIGMNKVESFYQKKDSDTDVISSVYTFSPKFGTGYDIKYGNFTQCVDTNGNNSCRSKSDYYISIDNCIYDSEKKVYKINSDVFARYYNVGYYNGVAVDLKITLVSINFSDSKNVSVGFSKNDIGIRTYSDESHKAKLYFEIEYLETGTDNLIVESGSFKSNISFTDIDNSEQIGVSNNSVEAVYIMNTSSEVARITGNSGKNIYHIDETADSSYYYYTGNRNISFICENEQDPTKFRNRWFSDSNCSLNDEYTGLGPAIIGIIDYDENINKINTLDLLKSYIQTNKTNFVYDPWTMGYDIENNSIGHGGTLNEYELKNLDFFSKAGIITVLFNKPKFTISWNYYYTGLTDSGFLKQDDQTPKKYISLNDDTELHTTATPNDAPVADKNNDTVKYTIIQKVANQPHNFQYTSWKIQDSLDNRLEFQDIEIFSGENDVHNSFNYSFDGNKLEIIAKDELLSSDDFINSTFRFVLKVKIKEDVREGSIIHNSANLKFKINDLEEQNKPSNTVYVKVANSSCASVLNGFANDNSLSNMDKLDRLFSLYEQYSDLNMLMNFTYDGLNLDLSGVSCSATQCYSNNYLSCENGNINSSKPMNSSVNSRVCRGGVGGYQGDFTYANDNLMCQVDYQYNLPFKHNQFYSGQNLWKSFSGHKIGSLSMSVICQGIVNKDDESIVIDTEKLPSSIFPIFTVSWNDNKQNGKLIYDNLNFTNNNQHFCGSEKCFVELTNNYEFDIIYDDIWYSKGLNGIFYKQSSLSSIDGYRNMNSGLPIPVDDAIDGIKEDNMKLSFSALNYILDSESCGYTVENQILNKDKSYNFDFRVIDTSNPFPGINGTLRNTGSNWCETSLIGSDSSDGSYIIGDLNGDGKIDENDLKVDYFKGDSSEYKEDKADLNGDGKIEYSNVCNENKEASDNCLLDSYINKNNNYCKGNDQNSIVKRFIYDRPDSSSNTPMYSITLTPADISEIRKYNKDHAYNEFNMKCENQNEKCTSNFISDWMDGKIDNLNSNAFDLNAWCMNDRVLNKKWCDNTEVTE